MLQKVMCLYILAWIFCVTALYGKEYEYSTEIVFDIGEYWWGGVVALGSNMPFIKPLNKFDLARQNNNNQVMPFFLSNKARYLCTDRPFIFEIKDKSIMIMNKSL